MMGYGFGGGMGGLMPLLFMGVLVFVAVWIVRSLQGRHESRGETPPSALDVLRRRYATGEIDREEYLRIKKELDS